MLAGGPGIGKTRITRELVTQADAKRAKTLWGWCYERLPTGLGFRQSGLTQRKQTLNCCARRNSSRNPNNPANPRADH